MKKLTLLIFASITLNGFSQNFSNYFYTSQPEFSQFNFREVVPLSTQELLVSCEYLDFGVYWMSGLIKLDETGHVIWAKQFPNEITATGRVLTAIETASGNYQQLSLYWDYESPHQYARLIEVSTDGDLLWSKELDLGIPSDFSNFCYGSLKANDLGELNIVIGSDDELIILHTTNEGDVIWSKRTERFGMPMVNYSGVVGIELSTGNHLYAYKSAVDEINLFLLDMEGLLIWSNALSVGDLPVPKSMVELEDGSVYLAGFTDENTSFLLKLDPMDGTVLWGKEIIGFSQDQGDRMQLSSFDSDLLLTINGFEKYRFMTLDSDGILLTSRQLYDEIPIFEFASTARINDQDYLYGTRREDDINYAFLEKNTSLLDAGCLSLITSLSIAEFIDFSSSPFSPVFSDFTAISDVTYSFVDMDVTESVQCLPSQLYDEKSIEQKLFVYPNPATSWIQLQLDAKDEHGEYTIYDVSGQLVLYGIVSSGQNNIQIGELEAGIYLLNVKTKTGNYQSYFQVVR